MEHQFDLKTAGVSLDKAEKALIMIHGRGSSAEDILSLSSHFNVSEFAILAPQATNNTWYPYSFMAAIEQNEPWLSSAIQTIEKTVQQVVNNGILPENIYFFGFSQGACLTLEYLARNAQKFGGASVIIGGLIGEKIDRTPYTGDFQQTPIFIGTSNPDFHVPIARVFDTEFTLIEMNANVTLKIFENFGHSINKQEIDLTNEILFK